MTPQQETTKVPSRAYSRWHRFPMLPAWCCHVDGDWFELRKSHNGRLVPVASIETITTPPMFIQNAQSHYPLFDGKVPLLAYLDEVLPIPVYVVRHTPDCSQFVVSRYLHGQGETEAIYMTEVEYKDFLMALGKGQ